MSTGKRDYSSTPFHTGVAIGESTTAGGSATMPQFSWAYRLQQMISDSQLEQFHLINSGIGGNVMSPRSPGYNDSGQPSAVERYQRHVLDHNPDLVFISYGLNDARSGTPLAQFLEDLEHVTLAIKQAGALIVIISAYFMTGFDRYLPFNQGNISTLIGYNEAMRSMAQKWDVLYADVFDAQAMAPWMIDPDGVHANNLGHQIIANRTFEVLAQNCSCLSQRAFELGKNFRPWRDESVLKRLY